MMGFGSAGGIPGHMYGASPFGGGFMFLGFFLFVGFIALLVWLVVRTARASQGVTPHQGYAATGPAYREPGLDESVQITRQRLARGEIDIEKYNQIMSALGQPGA